jgi:hypothetical protein
VGIVESSANGKSDSGRAIWGIPAHAVNDFGPASRQEKQHPAGSMGEGPPGCQVML